MEDKEVYNLYDSILANCVAEVINRSNKGYYIDIYNNNNKINLLLKEIIKICWIYKPLPILYYKEKGLKNKYKIFKFKKEMKKLGIDTIKIVEEKAKKYKKSYQDILTQVAKNFNCSKNPLYLNIYDTYYRKGAVLNA